MPLTQPLVCPVLVGREEFTRALASIRQEAAAGAGRVVLISGEAGIGKSRLLAELRAECRAAGWQTLEGNCFEPDIALPYSAWTDLFRRCLAGLDRAAALRALGREGGEIARLLPELAGVISAAGVAADPQQQKQRLVQEILRFLTAISASTPLAVLIEDIHWADEATLELLALIARSVPSSRMLLVATYRSDEVGENLGRTLAELDRQRVATELALDHLDQDEVRAMVQASLGPSRRPGSTFVDSVYALTEGNPFFIEEVLRSLVDDPASEAGATVRTIPRSVREAVRRRFLALGESARRVAQYAAVAGRRFDFEVLRRVCALDDASLVPLIRELVEAQLITEEAGDEFAFRHALTREAIYTSLLSRERKVLHRQIAEILEGLNPEVSQRPAGDLGYHFFEAEEWAKALHYSAVAAKEADRIYAPRSAIDHYTRAIVAADRLGQVAAAELYRGRGIAFDNIGEFERALADHERALQATGRSGDRAAEWQTLLDLGMLWAARDYSRSGEYYERAYELAKAEGSGSRLAHSLNRLGNWHLNVERPGEGIEYHRRALTLFEAAGDRGGLAATLDLLGMASYMSGDLANGVDYYQRAIPLLREVDNRLGLVSVLATMPVCGRCTYWSEAMMVAPLTLEEALASEDEALRIAKDVGLRSAESYVLWNRALVLAMAGEFGEALRSGRAGIEIAEQISHAQWIAGGKCAVAATLLDMFAIEDARAEAGTGAERARESGSQHWLRYSTSLRAAIEVEAGRPDTAEAVLTEVLDPETPARSLGQVSLWSTAAEVAIANGAFDEALRILERIESSKPDPSRQSGPRYSLALASALSGLGRHQESEAVLAKAAGYATEDGSRSRLWRLQAARGRELEALGRAEEARHAYEDAASVIRVLSPQVPASYREGFVAAALRRLPRSFQPVARSAAAQSDPRSLLTAREQVVAALLAQGKSNRVIADELVLSERTVETHVSNILGKLGFASRAEIAVWAVEQKLLAKSAQA